MSKKGAKKDEPKGPAENPYKVKGNQAFQDKEFDKAIEFYSIAIDDDQGSNHILFSNRSAAYAALRKFNDALVDADACIERQPAWAKGHFRRGLALEGLCRFDDALAAYQCGLTIEPTDALLLKATADLQSMLDDLKQANAAASAQQNPEHDRFRTMLEWLVKNGAKFPKLYLQYYGEDYRGVHCSTRIPTDEIILEVPHELIMTSEVAKASDIGKLVLAAEAAGLELRSKHSFLASFLLQELPKGADSYWHPYIDTLPKHYKNMPIFFPEADLAWLRGSMCIEKIIERKDSLRAEFDQLCTYIPSYAQFKFEDFVWARLVVITRIFGLVIGGNKTDGLVPMADMLNHRRPRETKWTYDEERRAFTITSLQPLMRGNEVYDSYGAKCNSRFFVNYGFALEENETDNEVMFTFDIPRSDPHYTVKMNQLGGQPRNMTRDCQIPTTYKEKKTRDAFAFLRYAHARDAELMAMSQSNEQYQFRVEDINPVSIRNEREVLATFKAVALRVMSGFETTLAEDNNLLKTAELTQNQRNCVIVRRGEKQVLQHYIDMCDECSPMFDQPWSSLKKVVQKIETAKHEGRFDAYIMNVVGPLVKLR